MQQKGPTHVYQGTTNIPITGKVWSRHENILEKVTVNKMDGIFLSYTSCIIGNEWILMQNCLDKKVQDLRVA